MAGKHLRVIFFGLGSIGIGIARVLAARPEYEIVGALDLDPSKVGRDLNEALGLKEASGVQVSASVARVLNKPAEVVVHATGSYLESVKAQLSTIIRAGHNIVSTCEELADPWAQNAKTADALDRLAKKNQISVVGTGINPGFAMDTLPLTLTAACQEVRRVRVRRVVDASNRRMQLQKKIGTGLTAAAFAEAAARKQIGHVGLTESASLIARGLGWTLDKIEEEIAPVLATRRVVTDYFTVEPNFVTGVRQLAHGIQGG